MAPAPTVLERRRAGGPARGGFAKGSDLPSACSLEACAPRPRLAAAAVDACHLRPARPGSPTALMPRAATGDSGRWRRCRSRTWLPRPPVLRWRGCRQDGADPDGFQLGGSLGGTRGPRMHVGAGVMLARRLASPTRPVRAASCVAGGAAGIAAAFNTPPAGVVRHRGNGRRLRTPNERHPAQRGDRRRCGLPGLVGNPCSLRHGGGGAAAIAAWPAVLLGWRIGGPPAACLPAPSRWPDATRCRRAPVCPAQNAGRSSSPPPADWRGSDPAADGLRRARHGLCPGARHSAGRRRRQHGLRCGYKFANILSYWAGIPGGIFAGASRRRGPDNGCRSLPAATPRP